MVKKYCENCEIELSEHIIEFERIDGIVFHFCSKECKNESIKFWRHKGFDIINIKYSKDIQIFSKG